MKIFFLFIIAMSLQLGVAVPGYAQPISASANAVARSNVSFSEILKLPFAAPDRRLAYGKAPEQFVLNWQHAHSTPAPVMITIHGGCWLNAYTVDHTYAMNTALRKAGFNVWSIEYRRVGDEGGGWPGSFADIQDALAQIATEFGGSDAFAKRDVTLVGHSAGGHLALLAAQQSSQLVDRVVGLAAIADLPNYAKGDNSCQQAAQAFMEGADPAAWQAANPRSKPVLVPSYLFHGDADSIVPPQQSGAYAETAKVEALWLKGAGHFDLIDPKSRAWPTIIHKLQQLSANN